MKMFPIAARNLLRNTRRSLLTGAAIAFGVILILIMVGIQEGSYEDMIESGVSQLAGHVVVQDERYQSDPEVERVVQGASAIAQGLQQALPAATIAPRMQLGGLLVSPTSSVGAGLMGMDPAAEATIQKFDDQLVEGAWLEASDTRGIVIGVAMADRLGVELGDKLVFMGQYGGDEMASRLFRVRGVFETGTAELDGFTALAHLEAAQELLGRGDVAHRVTVHLDDPHRTDEVRALVQERVDARGVVVLTWWEALPQISTLIQVDRVSGDVMLIILGIIVAMGALNTMLMSALERTREFGVMLAIGLKPGQVFRLVLTEGLVLGLAGAAAGLVLGLIALYPLVHYGFDYSAMMGGGQSAEMGGISLSTQIHAAYAPVRMGTYVLGAVVFATLAALYPAVHVARLEPVDAIHHV